MTADMLTTGELLTHRIRWQKTVDEVVGTLCDYHYIYGPDRSLMQASWSSMVRDAIVELAEGRDERMFKIQRVVKAMLDDMTEYSTYDQYDRDSIVEAVRDAGMAAYERHKRNTFKAKLAGDRNTYFSW